MSEYSYNDSFYNIISHFNLLDVSIHLPGSCSKIEMISAIINNPNLVLIIIENLCIGIILPIHIAFKFEYIKNLNNYHTLGKDIKYLINIVKLDNFWNTSNFSMQKLLKFNYNIDLIENKNMEEIKNLEDWELDKLDLNFLDALSWNDKKD